jgi:hypothetical protein
LCVTGKRTTNQESAALSKSGAPVTARAPEQKARQAEHRVWK